ncbi:MAG TPA: hypothetical protein VKT73_07295 [Xanthobacteraceae bacterium]|nr:hypothetical protein [Xanthobacteraceae bacterium]
MRKMMMFVSFPAVVLAAGLFAMSADAQTWKRGVAGVDAATQNFTPVEKAACYGWGPRCPPGRTWVCRYGNCWCARCW